jgi:hypothetical protein
MAHKDWLEAIGRASERVVRLAGDARRWRAERSQLRQRIADLDSMIAHSEQELGQAIVAVLDLGDGDPGDPGVGGGAA